MNIPGMRPPNQRWSWDETFLYMAKAIAQRSKDDSTQCGAVLVGMNKHVLACGYNGPPACLVDTEVPWNQRPEKYAFIIHAEENVLWDAIGSHGFNSVKGSSLYCTHAPCADCILRLAMHGVKEVVLDKNTPDYPLSKYQVKPERIIQCQSFPKLEIRRV